MTASLSYMFKIMNWSSTHTPHKKWIIYFSMNQVKIGLVKCSEKWFSTKLTFCLLLYIVLCRNIYIWILRNICMHKYVPLLVIWKLIIFFWQICSFYAYIYKSDILLCFKSSDNLIFIPLSLIFTSNYSSLIFL